MFTCWQHRRREPNFGGGRTASLAQVRFLVFLTYFQEVPEQEAWVVREVAKANRVSVAGADRRIKRYKSGQYRFVYHEYKAVLPMYDYRNMRWEVPWEEVKRISKLRVEELQKSQKEAHSS